MKKKLAVVTASALTLTVLSTSAFAGNITDSITSTTAQKIFRTSNTATTSGSAGMFNIKVDKSDSKMSHTFKMGGDMLTDLVNNSTTLTQAEKDKLLAVLKEIEPLQTQMDELFKSATTTETSDTKVDGGKTFFSKKITIDEATQNKIEDIRKQVEAKMEPVKDLMEKTLQTGERKSKGEIVFGEGFHVKSEFGGKEIRVDKAISLSEVKTLLADNTVLTQAEKDKVIAVFTEVEPLQKQQTDLATKYKAETDEAKKADLKVQMENVRKQIDEKISTIKDLMNKVIPQREFKMGKSFLFDDEEFNNLLADNTTLTQAEKDKLITVRKEVKEIVDKTDALMSTDKTTFDAATATQLEALRKQLQEKIDSVKDIAEKLMPSSLMPAMREGAGDGMIRFEGVWFDSETIDKMLEGSNLSDADKATVKKVAAEVDALQTQLKTLTTSYDNAKDDVTQKNIKAQMKEIQTQIRDKFKSVSTILKGLVNTIYKDINLGDRNGQLEKLVPSTPTTTPATRESQGTFKTTTTPTANWL